MKFDQAKSVKRKQYFINTPELSIETSVDDMNRITQFTATRNGKTKVFKVTGKDDAAITRAWIEVEKFVGNIKQPT